VVVRVAVLLSLVLLVLVVGGIVLYPTPLLGVDRAALAHSIDDEAAGAVASRCREASTDRWRCVLTAGDGSESADHRVTFDYRVTVDWKGCWTARPEARAAPGQRRLSGCIRLLDHELF
jgi:hypothetical protein